jgi:hypothetical protein
MTTFVKKHFVIAKNGVISFIDNTLERLRYASITNALTPQKPRVLLPFYFTPFTG